MGQVAFVPLPLQKNELQRWKFVLLDESIRKNTVAYFNSMSKNQLYFRDIENKELKSDNDNRPARQYMYLKFVVAIVA